MPQPAWKGRQGAEAAIVSGDWPGASKRSSRPSGEGPLPNSGFGPQDVHVFQDGITVSNCVAQFFCLAQEFPMANHTCNHHILLL